MSTLAIVLVAFGLLVILLFVGGIFGARRRARSTEGALRAQLEKVNQDLALAHAQDKGWERATMEAAAREAFAARHGDGPIDALHLVQVVDLPGTDADQAVFRVTSGGVETDVTLGRREGAWVAA